MTAESWSNFLVPASEGSDSDVLICSFHHTKLKEAEKIIGKGFQKEFKRICLKWAMWKSVCHKVAFQLLGVVFTVASLAVEADDLLRSHVFKIGDYRKNMRNQ